MEVIVVGVSVGLQHPLIVYQFDGMFGGGALLFPDLLDPTLVRSKKLRRR